jgi:hypothetical protein
MSFVEEEDEKGNELYYPKNSKTSCDLFESEFIKKLKNSNNVLISGI